MIVRMAGDNQSETQPPVDCDWRIRAILVEPHSSEFLDKLERANLLLESKVRNVLGTATISSSEAATDTVLRRFEGKRLVGPQQLSHECELSGRTRYTRAVEGQTHSRQDARNSPTNTPGGA